MATPSSSSVTADDVLRILIQEMEIGSRLPMSDDARDFLSTYRKSLDERLQDPDAWRREGGAVRHAARQLGVIASAIASLQRKVEVTGAMIDDAARVVERHCNIGGPGPRGRWCGREEEPEPGS